MFGATTPSTSFGATGSTGVFGQTASAFGSPLPFGGASTGAPTQFGAATPAFGGGSTFGGGGLFGAPTPSGGLGLATTTPGSTFGGGFGLGSTAQQPLTLGGTSQFGASPLLGQQQQQQQVQITHLATKYRRPVTYSTKVEDLDPSSLMLLQELEKKVKQHREHKRQLESFDRLQVNTGNPNQPQKSKLLRDELDMEVHVLSKKVQGLLSMLKADKQSLDSLYQICMKLVRRTEALSNASQRLKLRATTMQQMHGGSHAGVTPLPGDLGFRPPATPSPFLVESLANFEQSFDQMTQVVRELEQLHLPRGGGSEIRGLLLRQGIKEEDMDKSMSKILENFVVYFNHVLSQYSKVSHL